jgi:very-short-patch-repair endonuclease
VAGVEINVGSEKRTESGSRNTDKLIARIAARQHGVVARFQLLLLGVSPSAIRRRVAADRLHVIHRGVYAVGHARLTTEGRLLAAVFAGGRDAVLCDVSAAALWGFAGDDRHCVHVAAKTRGPRRGIALHRLDLVPEDVTTKSGIPVTTPARTLLDCATTMNTAQLEHAVREALYLRRTRQAALRRVVQQHRGHRGIRKLTIAVEYNEDAPGRTKSGVERRFLRFLRRRGLPLPELNVRLRVGDLDLEVDCYWREHGVIVELDHRSTHGRRQDFARDRRRDRALQVAGLIPLRVAHEDLTEELAAQLDSIFIR